MCGISGVVHRDGQADIGAEMTSMLQALRHRGPDSTGFALYGEPEGVAYHMEHKPKPSKPPLQVKRSVVEEMSGLAFEYIERLDVYENYVRDKKPHDVSPQTRALADLCLILFNSNEFIYVY